jgi:hypothetical protein
VSHRLLYRAADVLMAMGRLGEATPLYERACALPRGDTPSVDQARACHGLLVALDRGEHGRPPRLLRRLRLLDPDHRATRGSDFLSPAERDYYLALVLPVGCDRLRALERYLQAASGPSAVAVPLSYLRRAEAELRAVKSELPGEKECPRSSGDH